ncbi:MAG TPA: hypothetical protein PLL10_08965, partial [Elusimicrobiales bacterium]|nr:hypothetical protein [Elusimicrobiales bacterium]
MPFFRKKSETAVFPGGNRRVILFALALLAVCALFGFAARQLRTLANLRENAEQGGVKAAYAAPFNGT